MPLRFHPLLYPLLDHATKAGRGGAHRRRSPAADPRLHLGSAAVALMALLIIGPIASISNVADPVGGLAAADRVAETASRSAARGDGAWPHVPHARGDNPDQRPEPAPPSEPEPESESDQEGELEAEAAESDAGSESADESGSEDEAEAQDEPAAEAESESESEPAVPEPLGGLSARQMEHAATIVRVGQEMDLPEYAYVVAIATALQESNLRVLANPKMPKSLDVPNDGNGVDHDSVGLFQQRPSQGWGSIAQCMDPVYSARKFYQALKRVSGWRDMPVTVAAQTVQRSAYPDHYAKHEPLARKLVAALT